MSFLRACWSLLRKRCPRCRQGPIFERGWTMHARCPVCGLVYEPEPGYFMGSLYISYGMGTILIGLLMLGLHLLLPDWDLGIIVLMAVALFAPFAGVVTRYARVTWMYFDRWAWPAHGEPSDASGRS
jgi:uncharacterized protein (DUF983 family)